MASSEVQRTLVKSPPELWAELSDPVSLAQHLGHFGEIRIARVEPESTVEWEADSVHGAVHLKPSGWGTKVTLSITRQAPEPEAETLPEPEPALAAAEESAPDDPAPEAAERSAPDDPASEAAEESAPDDPALEAAEESAPDDPALEAAEESAPDDPALEAAEKSAPEPRPGFFARLFRRRQREQPVLESEPEQPQAEETLPEPRAETMPEPKAETLPMPTAETLPEPKAATPPEPADLAAELAEIEEALAEQDAALLSDVLDRLGAAHHRPFSRG